MTTEKKKRDFGISKNLVLRKAGWFSMVERKPQAQKGVT